ncbi:MAG: hypothetical protein BWZ10_00162 [candidate division BRC1 bacterium ADurb.BinA364]|nr:MAG: hypothetical protein BWZ10_00162 [candidate division BRC1 bacterium ADurb.BinA364]
MGSISSERSASGKNALKIQDLDTDKGSNVQSAPMPATAGAAFELRGQYYPVSGDGIGMYVRFYDERGNPLNEAGERGDASSAGRLGGADKTWTPFAFRFETPRGAASMALWIHSFNRSVVEGFLDDLAIVPAQ